MLAAKNLSRGSVDWLERVGLAGSIACMVHCLALPLLIAALPALASALAIPESFHIWVLVVAVPPAVVALVQGWRRHGIMLVLIVGAAGVGLLAAGAVPLGETWAEIPATVTGSLLLVSAHIANWRLRHAYRG